MGSSELTWERINTIDVGLDLGFLDDQIILGFDWFQRTTNDMLAPGVALPGSIGADAPYTNNGSLRTRGWELSVEISRGKSFIICLRIRTSLRYLISFIMRPEIRL